MLIPSYAIGPNPNSRGYSLQFPLGGSRRGGARDAGLGPAGLRTFLKRRGIRAIIKPARPQRRSLLVGRKETAPSPKPSASPISTPCWISRKLPTAGHAGTADRGRSIPRRAPFMLKCSGGQDRTSFAARSLLDSPRRLASGWQRRQAQFARFPYLHFPKDPAALAESRSWLLRKRSAGGRPLGGMAGFRTATRRKKAESLAGWVADWRAATVQSLPAPDAQSEANGSKGHG